MVKEQSQQRQKQEEQKKLRDRDMCMMRLLKLRNDAKELQNPQHKLTVPLVSMTSVPSEESLLFSTMNNSKDDFADES